MTWRARVSLRLGALELDVDLRGGDAPMVLVGPNGAGKTTLLRTIAGAHRPSSGQIAVGERLLFDDQQRVDLEPERRGVAYVPQGYGLFPHLSVTDNVAFGLMSSLNSLSARERRERARSFLKRVGALHLADRRPGELSGGEQQRVALARALIVEPSILLLDEPLSALDASARRSLRALLSERLAELGRPSLVVTHDPRDIRALGADVVVLEAGRIVQRGPVDELGRSPASDFVAELFEYVERDVGAIAGRSGRALE